VLALLYGVQFPEIQLRLLSIAVSIDFDVVGSTTHMLLDIMIKFIEVHSLYAGLVLHVDKGDLTE
jgi:hypothetical protein